MKSYKLQMWLLAAGSAVLMSLPFLIPGAGLCALTGFVPLLWMDRIADGRGQRHVWVWHYAAFVLWNALTTFWIRNATLGGAVFAVLANAFQMSLIFGAFRLSKRHFTGSVPYIFLAVLWIAWERFYFHAQISWPWLTLGNAFARQVSLIQWYEYTGSLGGSLWVWLCNLTLFGLLDALASGSWKAGNSRMKTAVLTLSVLLFLGPIFLSEIIYRTYKETGKTLEVAILQPNIDPYNKFGGLTREAQNRILTDLGRECLRDRYRDSTAGTRPLLVLAPETFTNDVDAEHVGNSPTFRNFRNFLQDYPGVNLIFGASSHTCYPPGEPPTVTARRLPQGGWYDSHNSAIIMDGSGRSQIYHKSKLVVGVELTPFPAFFCKVDDRLGGVMGRCVGQKEPATLDCLSFAADGSVAERVPVGCAICYESVYGEHCTGYVNKGAQALAVITNDAWWGDTPGYRQHLSYSCLRAVETRRDIARCANTGISAFIDQRGEILARSRWWQAETMRGAVHLNGRKTFYVENGDVVGKLCTFLCAVLALGLLSRMLVRGGRKRAPVREQPPRQNGRRGQPRKAGK